MSTNDTNWWGIALLLLGIVFVVVGIANFQEEVRLQAIFPEGQTFTWRNAPEAWKILREGDEKKTGGIVTAVLGGVLFLAGLASLSGGRKGGSS